MTAVYRQSLVCVYFKWTRSFCLDTCPCERLVRSETFVLKPRGSLHQMPAWLSLQGSKSTITPPEAVQYAEALWDPNSVALEMPEGD